MKPKQPCLKECPDRSPECHSKCEKWLIYEKALHEFYKERGEAYNQAYILNEMNHTPKTAILRLLNEFKGKVITYEPREEIEVYKFMEVR